MANRTVSVALKAEIGQYVSGMSKAAAATMRVGETAKKAQADSSKGFDLAGKGALLMGGALVAGLGMAIKKSMDFEKSMSAVQAATQASGATLDALRATAIKAGADTMYSATEAANGITEMAKAGVSAKDIMGGGLAGALNLAAAGQMDVADAAGIASTAMVQFRLSGAQLPHVADLLAAGAGKAMGSVDDLGQALNQAGLLASATGISIEETTGTLAAFASAGLIGSDAGTSFKTMLQMLQAPSSTAQKQMDALGLSAYDAQGKFVGITALAQELKDKLGPLTQAERDHALATIFGTDASRAANVLYREGAKGIQDWTTKVNDAGYAQRQAAQLTDNLSGDLERLGGSFDTLMISLGSGAQGPLRDVVQMLTGIANSAADVLKFWSSLPGPVQLAVVAAAGWAVAGGRIMDLFGKMNGALGPLRGAWQSFGQALGYARANGDGLGTVLKSVGSYAGGQVLSGIKSLAKAVGPELGIAAAVYGVSQLIDGFQLLTGASDAAKASAKGLADALTLTDDAADRRSVRKAVEDVDGLTAALGEAGVSSRDAMNGLLGQAGATDRVTTALQNYINLHPGGVHSKEATAALMALHSYEALATGYGTAAGNARFFADSAADAATGTDTSASSAGAAAPQVDTYTKSLQDASQAASDAKTQTDLFKLSLDILTGKTIDTSRVEAAFYDAVSKSDGAMKGLHGSVLTATGSLNVQSEAGRKAQGVLFDIRDANNQVIATMIQNGATTAQVTAKDAELRKSFIASARQMGISKAAAEKLANQILGIPKDRNTKITADTSSATAAIVAVQKKINGLTGKTLVIKAEYLQTNGLGSMPGRHTMTASFAEGGYTGHGGKHEPMGVVHGGEYVFTKEETAKAGVGNLASYAKSLRGYANGGPVGITVNFTQALDAVQKMASSVASASAAGAVGGGSVGGGAGRWLGTVLQVLAALGQSPSLAGGILKLIQAESGGNQFAVNNWDSNARAGHPSQGLMQTIPSTFYTYAGPYGGRGITDPFANIYAGVNYALHRYGASMLAGGGRHSRGGSYVGYFNGVESVPHDDLYRLHSGERVMTREQNAAYTASREVAGGRSAASSPMPVVVKIDGARISGRLEMGTDGLVTLVDGRIDQAFGGVHDLVHNSTGF